MSAYCGQALGFLGNFEEGKAVLETSRIRREETMTTNRRHFLNPIPFCFFVLACGLIGCGGGGGPNPSPGPSLPAVDQSSINATFDQLVNGMYNSIITWDYDMQAHKDVSFDLRALDPTTGEQECGDVLIQDLVDDHFPVPCGTEFKLCITVDKFDGTSYSPQVCKQFSSPACVGQPPVIPAPVIQDAAAGDTSGKVRVRWTHSWPCKLLTNFNLFIRDSSTWHASFVGSACGYYDQVNGYYEAQIPDSGDSWSFTPGTQYVFTANASTCFLEWSVESQGMQFVFNP